MAKMIRLDYDLLSLNLSRHQQLGSSTLLDPQRYELLWGHSGLSCVSLCIYTVKY